MAAYAVGAVTAAVVVRLPRRTALALVLVAAIAIPVVSLDRRSPLSDDLYRYSFDGTVQSHGVDPYRYPPDDPALDRFHDTWLFPGAADCAAIGKPAGCTRINRPTDRTIYPPVAELYFLAVHVTRLDALQDRGVELAGLLVALALLAAMLALLRATGRDERLVAWWACAPLAAFELVADAHVDGLAALLAVLGLLAARRDRPLAAAALISLAALTKLYPALLIVAALQRRWRDAAKQVVVFVVVFALGYAPHVAAVGGKVLGYLPGYLAEEHYDSGTRYLLLDTVGLRGHLATAAVVAVMAVVVGLVLWRRPPPELAATVLYGALLLTTTPVQPWYAAGLAAVAVCAGRPEWLAVAVAGYATYFAAFLHGSSYFAGAVAYAAALLLVAVVWLSRRAAGPSRTPPSPVRTSPPVGSPAR